MLKHAVSTIATFAILTTSTSAIDSFQPKEDRSLVGKTVTVIKDGAELTSDGKVVGHADLGDSYKVDGVKGNLLIIKERSGNLAVWDVVPYQDAIDYFTRRIESEPESYAYDQRGRYWQKRGALNLAVGDFNKAIDLDPKAAHTFVNRGLAWEECHDLDKAIADFTEAIQIRPGYIAAVADRGNAWVFKGNHAKAIADCDEAIRIEPEDPRCYNNRGWAYRLNGDFDAAMKDFSEAIRLNPHYGLPHKNRADIWIRRHEYDKAIEEVNEALRLNSLDARFFITRANARLGKGLIDDAIADFEHATKMDPAMGHNSMAWFRATSPDPKLRNGAQALQEATKACELSDWKSDSYLQSFSAALAEQGNFSEAIAHLQKAIDANPDYDRETKDKMMVAFKAGKPYRDAEYHFLP
jgi:tetratricopeptide (TPR) repeat protein